MSLDLNDLLRDWPHEPGMIKVRKILGSDGKEKIQLRIDLGLIQMETAGPARMGRSRTTASRCSNTIRRARAARRRRAKTTRSTADEIGELQQEGIQYYHRYI